MRCCNPVVAANEKEIISAANMAVGKDTSLGIWGMDCILQKHQCIETSPCCRGTQKNGKVQSHHRKALSNVDAWFGKSMRPETDSCLIQRHSDSHGLTTALEDPPVKWKRYPMHLLRLKISTSEQPGWDFHWFRVDSTATVISLLKDAEKICRQESRSSNSILDVPLDPEAASSHIAAPQT